MEIKGKVIEKLPLQSGTSSRGEWKKATIVVEIPDGQYTTKLALDNLKEADAFDKIAVGSEGTFNVNVSSRKSNDGRWFTSCTCWRWEIEGGSEQAPQTHEVQPTPQPTATTEPTAKADDDMPF